MHITTKKLFTIMVACLWAVMLQAQTTKSVTVSWDKSFTDHLTLKNDTKDMDLMVRLLFNQDKNTLTVSLISYRSLFVFRDDVRYKSVIKWRRLHPEKLPYVVKETPTERFRLSKEYTKTLPKPRKKYIFKKWIEVEGLQPVDQELKMVNDYIEQTFNIPNYNNNVVVRLRDIMLMELVKEKGLSKNYEIVYGKDLNLEYQINIQRDPCFGVDEEKGVALKSLAAIQKGYAAFKKRYAKGTVSTKEALDNFKEWKETLQAQFPLNNDSSACSDIMQIRRQYNQIVDSIKQVKVKLKEISTPAASNAGGAGGAGGEGDAAGAAGNNAVESMGSLGGKEGRTINAKSILANTRLLDSTISRWLVSKDETERNDLATRCRNIIKDTSLMISGSRGQTPEERNAINLFHKAEQYFYRVCR